MQMLILSEKDLNNLQGKYILQIDKKEPDKSLMDFPWGFAKEKRLKIVVGFGVVNLWGEYRDFKTYEAFKDFFNHYLYPHMVAEGMTDGGRFHRLLRNDELDYLLSKIKEENY